MARTGGGDISTALMEDSERSTFRGHHRRPADQIARATEVSVPGRLGALLPPSAAGRYPDRPLDAGL